MPGLRFDYRVKTILAVAIIMGGYALSFGQSNITESARETKSGTETSHTIADAVQTIGTSPAPVPKERTFSYQPDMQKDESRLVMFRLNKKSYYKTISLVSLSKPEKSKMNHDNFQSNVILGLNRPYYYLKNDFRVIGNFDLRFDNILWGYPNSTTITLGYDLKKTLPNGSSDLKIKIDYVAFKVGIPIRLK
jgi:hypothetical protein